LSDRPSSQGKFEAVPVIEFLMRNFDENLSLSLSEVERALAFHLKMPTEQED
jgi:hypothetical protein